MMLQKPEQRPAEETLLRSRHGGTQALVHQRVQPPTLCLRQRRESRLRRQVLPQQIAQQRTARLRLKHERQPLPCGATTKTASLQLENASWLANAKLAMHELQFCYDLVGPPTLRLSACVQFHSQSNPYEVMLGTNVSDVI